MLIFLLAFYLVRPKIYLDEKFDEGFEKHWVVSEDKSVTHGELKVIEKDHCVSDHALKFLNDSSFYHASRKFDTPFDTKAHSLYFHYVAQYQKDHDCGGAYVKLFTELDQKALTRDSPYAIMVGPDACGYSTKTVHLIISHKGVNYPLKSKVSFDLDQYPHLISLYIGKDRTFWLKVDGEIKSEGTLKASFDYLLPETIDDPEDKKPEDWEDSPTIDDPEDKKPEDWDDRKEIPDPNAQKPEDWNEKEDEEWEPDLIPNPSYKGEWAPKQITNPKYKGVWSAKQIPNPSFVDDTTFGDHIIPYVGVDIWTVKSGQILDDLLLTDDEKVSKDHEKKVLEEIKKITEKMKEAEKSEKKEEPEESRIEEDEKAEKEEKDEVDEEMREEL